MASLLRFATVSSIRRWLATAAAAALVGAPTAASAQSAASQIRIDQLQMSTPGSPFLRAEGPVDPFDKGIAYGFRLTADYGFRPLRTKILLDDEETDDAFPVEHALLLHLGAALSPLDWLGFELAMPFAVFEKGSVENEAQCTDTVVEGCFVNGQQFDEGKAGVGDLRIGAHVRPYISEELDFLVGIRVWAPSGSGTPETYMSGDNPDFVRIELVPAVAGEVDFFMYGCTAGIAPLFFAGRNGDRLALSCAAHFKLAPLVHVGIEPHIAAFAYPEASSAPKEPEQFPGFDETAIAVQFEPMAVLGVRIADFSIGAGIGLGVGGAPGTPTARAALTFAYASRGERVVEEVKHDADLDGIEDEYDACPHEAGLEDRRGCPAKRDPDGDGIIEGDACPDKPGQRYDDPQANGCPDRDNDHFPDPVDPCPIEPGATTEGCPQFARYKDGRFVVDPPIAFDRGTARLSADAHEALREVIRTIRVNPKIQQISVVIGARGAARKLTDDRAAAVLELFTDENIDSSRFEVVLDDKLESGKVQVKAVR
jgi:hypothetical protein